MKRIADIPPRPLLNSCPPLAHCLPIPNDYVQQPNKYGDAEKM